MRSILSIPVIVLNVSMLMTSMIISFDKHNELLIFNNMGRTLEWFVVLRDAHHEPEKELCFGWEFQDDEDVMDDQISDKTSSNLAIYEVLHEEPHKSKWCPKCRMFYDGLDENHLVVASMSVYHSSCSYSNWCIEDMWLGSSSTPFAGKFRPDFGYKEVLAEDVARARRTLEELGDPMRRSDKLASDETHKVLDFLEKWLASTTRENNKHVVLMYQEM